MNQREIEYALAKQVPDLERGFTIATNYGDIVIEPGGMANSLASALRLALKRELRSLEGNIPSERDSDGFNPNAQLIGGDWVHGAAQLSVPDAQTISDLLVAQDAEVAARLQALSGLIANLYLAVCHPLAAGPLSDQPGSLDLAQPGGAPAANTRSVAPSASCVGLALLHSAAPVPAIPLSGLSSVSPKVEE